MEWTVVVVLSLGGVAVGAPIAAYVRRVAVRLQRRRSAMTGITRVTAAPHTRIAEAEEGALVRLTGVIEASATIEAPLSGRAVVAHETVIEQITNALATEHARERLAIDFVLDDGTGRARVVVRNATLLLEQPVAMVTRDRVDRILARRGQPAVGLTRSREGVLLPKSRVVVVGRARWEPDPDAERPHPDASYRASAEPQRLVVEGTDDEPLVMTNLEAFVPVRAAPNGEGP